MSAAFAAMPYTAGYQHVAHAFAGVHNAEEMTIMSETKGGARGKVIAVCVGFTRGKMKKPVEAIELREEHGVVDDCHAGPGLRQVSLTAIESIVLQARSGVVEGTRGFSENITTEGINLQSLRIGQNLRVGAAHLQVTEVGRRCDGACARQQPAEFDNKPSAGIFAAVVAGGVVHPGDVIQVLME